MTITSTLADRTARLLGRRSDRRSFLVKAAVASSAAVVAGREYVLKPGSAYAGVCNCRGRSCDCGALCCDGYTEFCCAIYGSNSCPPGTLLAGWWKVDNSSFCSGAARYYMDCNQSVSCGCGSSGVCAGTATCQCRSCGNRKDGCTQFRYGNCNNQVRCVGPIMCRVVTCTKPWEIEPTCTTATRVDNNTRFHHRPCLEPPPPPHTGTPRGSITSVTAVTGGYRIRGTAEDGDSPTPVKVQVFVDRQPVQSAATSASHAFDVTIQVPPGKHEICVYAQNVDPGNPKLLGCVTRSR